MSQLRNVCLLLASLSGLASAQLLGKVTVTSPKSLKGTYRGYFGVASVLPPPADAMVAYAPIGDGCLAFDAVRDEPSLAIVSLGGNCSLHEKVANARHAGMKGMMVVSDSAALNLTAFDQNTMIVNKSIGIFVMEVASDVGKPILEHSSVHSDDFVRVELALDTPTFPLLDPSVLCLIALAVSLVALGAWFSTAAQRENSPIAPISADQVMEVQWWVPAVWFVVASLALVVLYFLMNYLIYIILGVFALGGVNCMTEIGSAGLKYNFPSLGRRVFCFDVATLIAFAVGVSNSVAWFVLRKTEHAWPFQNLIGICFLCFFQRSIQLPNIKLGAVLLTLMFFFDIFWVFGSPVAFSGNSVMVVVATGGDSGEEAPMMLRLPAFNDPLGSPKALGYGDIALPGLLVSMLLRYDILHYRKCCKGYFVPSLIGYGVGLCCALVGLYVMRMSQPALLYLVPGTLGTTLVLACKRREVGALWNWDGAPDPSVEPLRSNWCPKGHALQSCPAPSAGTCDVSGVRVAQGDPILFCSICDYYVCEAARPVEEAPAEVTAES